MKTLIEYIAKSLVDHPEEVQVSEVEGEHCLCQPAISCSIQ